jgi:hypothetical protein
MLLGLILFAAASGCLEGKHRPFADEPVGALSDDPLGSSSESPASPTGSSSNEFPPAIGGLDGNENSLSGAAAPCDGDPASCPASTDIGADPACVPTGPRDCSSDLDNDCDGQPDNVADEICPCVPGSVQACEEHPGLDGRGPCRAGLQTCFLDEATLTSAWGPCEGSVGPGEQDSCTIAGDDTDCDGAPNSGCSCVEGETQDCGPNTTNGICRNGTSTCTNGAFGQCEGAVFPAARDSCEVLGDDSNCNGTPSEGCSCVNGETQPCGPDTDTGNCQRGTRTCVDGAFGQCVGAIFAAPRDSCTVRGDDANCNGVPNDGCACIGNETRTCGPSTDVGNCQFGTQTCANGAFGQCVGAVSPAASDSCTTRGDDANCNGVPNDGCGCVDGETRPCGPATDAGICQRGTQTCVNGSFGQCVGAVFAAARNCGSQQDNDCDGLPDNTIDNVCSCAIGQTRACNTHPGFDGVGPCRAGQQTCVAGANNSSSSFGTCTGAVGPAAADSCTQLNNDANCNGRGNDGCQCIGTETRSCGTNTGNCQAGTQTCSNGVLGPCVGEIRPAASDSCSIADDDANCNGVVNDNCGECLIGETQPCGATNTNTGQCNIGTQTCANGQFGQCVGEVPRRSRDCNSSLDNDCDGRADNIIDNVCREPLGSQCQSSTECASGFCVDGVCCAERCNGDCESCNQAGQCVADPPRTACAPQFSQHFICDGLGRGNSRCQNPTVSCGSQSCPVNNETTCCYGGATGNIAPFCGSRADCQTNSGGVFESQVDCDSVNDCQTGEVCCSVSASTSQIFCGTPGGCVNSPVSSASQICGSPGPPPFGSVSQTLFPGFVCR